MISSSQHSWKLLLLIAAVTFPAGCSSTGGIGGCDIPAVPANRLPDEFLSRPKSQMNELSLNRLRQTTPDVYQLAAGDILGVYIETVLGSPDMPPPVTYPESGDQPPALGFPIPIREDGTLALPLIDPINVEGLTLTQATEAIQRAYTIGKKILPEGKDRVIVTLMRRRKYRVLVVREEGGGREGVTKRGTGMTVDLPAYENDVLHALNETGGFPGLDAKNEILIIRGDFQQGVDRDKMIAAIQSCQQPCECPPELPGDPNVTVIPIRYYPENVPTFKEEDVILKTGDIVYIPTRETERFYTGGILGGGSQLLPRDYDLDVLAAVAEAGGQVSTGGTGIAQIGGNRGGGGGRGGAGAGGAPASNLIVLRKLECGGQIPIRVNLNRALVDPSERILVQPEDTLILRYTLLEEVYNAALSLIQFNFLFNGLQGGGF